MAHDRLAVALLSEVFPDAAAWPDLQPRLAEARARGAELVVLPELPLMPWSPAVPTPRAEDAEPPEGPRHQALAGAARAAGVALLGGAIVEEEGVRRNRALLFDADGRLLAHYDKLHLPDEDGFRERAHYREGDRLPRPIEVSGFPLAIQLCSDLNRPELSHALAAAGAYAILGPRATEASSWPRWRTVLEATARTACVYVLSVTRPRDEQGVPLGGPSYAASPGGETLLESGDPLALVTLERAAVTRAHRGYPGYLRVRADLYAAAWEAAARVQAIAALAAADEMEETAAEPHTTTRGFPIQS